MEEIIVIRTSDPRGDIFQSIINILNNENIKIFHAAEPADMVLSLGDITIFPERRQVFKAEKEIHLNYGEFSILHCMAQSPGQVFSREQLYHAAWSEDYELGTNTVDNTIWRLRNKLENDPTEAVAKGRDAAARFHHADEGARIVRPRAAETVHDYFVARELEVTVREHVHDPHERIEPVDADGGDERELGERVEALDVDKLVLQNEAQSALVRPVGRLRHQNDRAQDAERQRGRDAVRLADDELAAQRMRCKPAAGIVVFDRQRGLEFAIAPDVEHRKCQRTDLNAHKPDDCPRRDRRRGRRSDLRHDGDGCRRQDRRRRDGGGIRYRRCLTRKQRVDAQARGERERHKQPHERECPEHQKRLFRHLVERQRAENGDDRDHHRAVQAHLQKAHPFTLIPARRRSS